MYSTEKTQPPTPPSDPEKANIEQKSLESGDFSEVDLANYYEEKAGSLVVDPA